MHMYNKCYVAPSHGRFAHPSWIAGMKLMLDCCLVPVNTDTYDLVLSIIDLLKSMSDSFCWFLQVAPVSSNEVLER